MPRAHRRWPSACAALLAAGCARGVGPIEADAAYSGVTDLGALPDDIIGTAWDDYPDKGHLVDVVAVDSVTRDAGASAVDVGVPRDIVTPTGGCGRPGEPCCASSRCASGATCRGGVCAEAPTCGAAGQPCCGIAACGPGNVCTASRCVATVTCGASGGACCASTNPCLPSLLCVGGACAPCGSAGQACCAGSAGCFGGLSCSAGLCRAVM